MTTNESRKFVEELFAKRSKWVKANMENDFTEGIANLLSDLYSYRGHFIYELLQNAEDAEAKWVRFELQPTGLKVIHNGKRLFTPQDVESITSIGRSTKRNDLNQIGKFGYGFKSVFFYTASPRIHSGPFSFEIEELVCPRPIDAISQLTPENTTFELPFNSKVSPKDANSDIRKALLEDLSPRAIMFLKNVERIEIVFGGGQKRELHRVRDNQYPAEILVEETGKISEEWCVFERQVKLEGVSGIRVEIAFKIEMDNNIPQHRRIVPIKDYPLVVFFPTGKATNLGFLIQGPYRTTPARDNVPEENENNRVLIKETAGLVVEALEKLRDQNLLTVDVLGLLPIDPVHFPKDSMFWPIFEDVRAALVTKCLLPAYSENDRRSSRPSFTSGSEAKLARSSDLRKLLSGEQLADLCGTPANLRWISEEITADKTPALFDYLQKILNIEEIDPESFVRRINSEFLIKQSDEWIVSFYGFLLGQRAWFKELDWRRKDKFPKDVYFFKKPIIRLNDGNHIEPYSDRYFQVPSAFLPSSVGNNFRTVKTRIAEKEEAQEFLKKLGYAVPELVDEVIERILPQYTSSVTQIPTSFYTDFKTIMEALKTDSETKKKRLIGKLAQAYWILAENASSGEKALKKPSEVYIRSKDLEIYFSGNPNVWFLDREFNDLEPNLADLGVSKFVRVNKSANMFLGYVLIKSEHGFHMRGLKGFDPDSTIDGLDFALESPAVERSRYIWNSILRPHSHLLKGILEFSTRQDYYKSHKEEKLSEIGQIATTCAWLPSPAGEFRRPSELRLDELPDDFEKDEQLAKQLEMILPPAAINIQALAEAIGVEVDDIEFLRSNREEFQRIKQQLKMSQKKPLRPVAESHDRSARDKKIREAAKEASPVERKEKTRTVRVSKAALRPEIREYLQNLNTNIDEELICQLCHEIMPFKVEDGYFFEAVECVWGIEKETRENHLALCPNCAAKYEHANKYKPEEIKDKILNSVQLEISLNLAGEEHSIFFTEKHLQDLKVLLSSF